MKLRSKRLLLALGSSVFTLAGLEIVARIYLTQFADSEWFSRFASLEQYREQVGAVQWRFGLFAPHRYMGYIAVPNLVEGQNRHNRWGFRGEEIAASKPEGEFRIACLGASTTYSVAVPGYRKSYPATLQKELQDRGFHKVSVINGGVPGWSSYETLINYLLRIQELHPDLIIIHQGFGDVMTRVVWPPEAYKGDNSGYFAQVFAVRHTPLYERSTILRMMLVQTGQIQPPSVFGKNVFNPADTAYFVEFVEQIVGEKFPTGIFDNVSIADMIEANPPTYFRRNTEDLVIAAQGRGVQPVLMTFAYTREVGPYFDVEGFKSAIDAHNDIMRDIARRFDVPLMDLAKLLPGDKRFWSPDGIHVNEQGTALKVRLLARFLVERGLVSRSSR